MLVHVVPREVELSKRRPRPWLFTSFSMDDYQHFYIFFMLQPLIFNFLCCRHVMLGVVSGEGGRRAADVGCCTQLESLRCCVERKENL
jgi:hypothetical protein